MKVKVLLLAVFILTLVSLSSAQTHSVNLSWTQSTSSNVTGNNVYRGTTTGGPYTKIFTSSSPITAYLDSTVTAASIYYYVVTATCVTCNPQESSFSNEFKATIPSNAPLPPTGLAASSQ